MMHKILDIIIEQACYAALTLVLIMEAYGILQFYKYVTQQ